MKDPILIQKFSGERVAFDDEKLLESLLNAQADENMARKIVGEVRRDLYDGIPTHRIYQKAFKLLKGQRRSSAARYKMKKAIMELGPSGYPFEKFIGHIFEHDGYQSEVGITMNGKCVTHEVDVLAKKDSKVYIIECKYHNRQGKANDVKIPLYIHSRFQDIRSQLLLENGGQEKNYHSWIFTNTRFSLDAIAYAKCYGMNLVSWDYPEKKSLKYRINRSKLYPITSLTALTQKEKGRLLEDGFVLVKELYADQTWLKSLGISSQRSKKILDDIEDLCER